MTIDTLRTYCLSMPAATEDLPFDNDTLAFRVGEQGKIFGLIGLERLPPQVNLKCDPERAVELREAYEGIMPGYHMNKRHWNTVHLQGVPPDLLRELVDHSYALIVQSLKVADRQALGL
ncbi:MAG: MmcQ/YjbR family DNA-binding protein [Bacteroidota bacterium]